jgi:CRISPR-associated protein Cas4
MNKGQQYHEQKIRKKTQTKKDNATIYYNRFLVAPDLGLAALFDAFVEENGAYYPIEFKTGKKYHSVPEHHKMQVVVQAIILESIFNVRVTTGEIRYGSETRITLPITLEDKHKVLTKHSKMLTVVLDEILPEPTPHQNKCRDCEFWLYCRRA